MLWQDAVMSTGAGIFAAALWPTMRNPEARVPRSSSGPTCLVLLAFVIAHASLDLWWTAATEFVCAAMWAAIWRWRPTS